MSLRQQSHSGHACDVLDNAAERQRGVPGCNYTGDQCTELYQEMLLQYCAQV